MLNKKGFTLMEALIAASIFGMLSIIGASVFINISQSQRSTESYSALYEDARVIMETLANEIRNGTVDYEEYFNIEYTNEISGEQYYGINRGVYASRFYDPGYTMDCNDNEIIPGKNPENLGVEYLDENGKLTECNGAGNPASIFPLSVDKDMGRNPYNWDGGNSSDDASAMSSNEQTELYLISKDGRNKTILKKQQMNADDWTLSVLRLTGEDTDGNGVIDGFFCQPGTQGCHSQLSIKPFQDATKLFAKYNQSEVFDLSSSPFTPISPLRSNVSNLKFIITPTEDPYKAFDEPGVQIHPSVTIVLTLEPSSTEKQKLPIEKQNQKITVQTTVATGVTSRIKTYPPTSDLSWINISIVDSIE